MPSPTLDFQQMLQRWPGCVPLAAKQREVVEAVLGAQCKSPLRKDSQQRHWEREAELPAEVAEHSEAHLVQAPPPKLDSTVLQEVGREAPLRIPQKFTGIYWRPLPLRRITHPS